MPIYSMQRSLQLKRFSKQLGFSLLELMIALTLMSLISIAVYQNTTQSFQLTETLSLEADFYSSTRIAFDMIDRDVLHMYSPQRLALLPELAEAAPLPGQASPQRQPNQPPQNTRPFSPEPPTDFWGETINEFRVRPTRFNGDANRMSFVTNAHIRLFKELKESEFEGVIYQIEDVKKGKALVRLATPNVFIDRVETDKLEKVYILSSIQDANFEYLDAETDNWLRSWDSTQGDTRGRYPALVRVTLELLVPKPKKSSKTEQSTLKVSQTFRSELYL